MKKVLCIIFALVIFCVFSSCAAMEYRPEPLSASDVAQVTGSTAVYSSMLYVVNDTQTIRELVDLYNGLTYRELKSGEEAPDDLLFEELYTLMYYDKNGEFITDCWISPEGYVRFRDDFETVFVLTSDFDAEHVKELLEQKNIIR